MNDDIACPGCDLIVNVSALQQGQSASCPRCGHFLTRMRNGAFDRIIAFAVAGLVFLALSLAYPFLSFSSSGFESVMTLPQTPGTLWGYGMPEIALVVSAFIIVIPAVVLVMILSLCVPLRQRRHTSLLAPLARGIFTLQTWAMVEVFIIGVIVALTKIAALATVVVGFSFWAYALFAVCFIISVANLDRYQCWQLIEALGVKS